MLADVALEADPEVRNRARYSNYQKHLRRAEAGKPPGLQQRINEFSRRQINRVRWRLWDAVGIS